MPSTCIRDELVIAAADMFHHLVSALILHKGLAPVHDVLWPHVVVLVDRVGVESK
jgi:hypothetical protein